MSNLSSKDKKDRKGFVRYSSAGGASSLRRYVEEHHKSSHENVRKRLREKVVIESEYPKRNNRKPRSSLRTFLTITRSTLKILLVSVLITEIWP